jgi:UDP-glucuronate 4-epimerase
MYGTGGLQVRILLTGTQGHRKGFIANRFLERFGEEFDIVEYLDDITTGTFIDDYDMVVHLAAMAGVRHSHEQPELYWKVNVEGSKRLFEFYDRLQVPVIYASSSSVYEWWLSPYATTKWAMEALAPERSLGLRFHTVYGPNSREDMLYDMLLNRKVHYLTDHTRDWTHVDDVCAAIHTCIYNFFEINESHKAIDVGTGDPVSVVDMAETVWVDNCLPVRQVAGEREHTIADPRILKSYGWHPRHHILDGVGMHHDV